MVEDTNPVTVIPPRTAQTSIRRRKLWITIGVIFSILIIAIVIPTSIVLTRKKDPTTSSATTTELTISTSTKIETLTNRPLTMLDINSTEQMKWKQHATTVAGGNGDGNQLNQFSHPKAISIDHNQIMYIADSWNYRIVQWKPGENEGQIIVGRNRSGDQTDQWYEPTDVCFDQQSNSLIIADRRNSRVIRCSIQNPRDQQILFSDIDCWGVTMDKHGSIYVSDWKQNEVRRWKKGETLGTIVAGGHGSGNHLNQFSDPTYLFVDEDESIYVSDNVNHRVMKWFKDAREGIVVAGGNGQGNSLNQFSLPSVIIMDHLGQIYVADCGNHRVMRWCQDCKEGEVVVGGNGRGNKSNQLHGPHGLSFDIEGNLYVSELGNLRVQKFAIDLK